MTSPRNNATVMFGRANTFFKEGRYANALDILADLNGRFPNTPNILFSMALCLEMMNERDKAVSLCEKLIRQSGDFRVKSMMARLAADAELRSAPCPAKAQVEDSFEPVFGKYRGLVAALSVGALIAANLVPLVGAALFHWDVFAILLIFWTENIVIGAFNVLKMLFAQGVAPSPGPGSDFRGGLDESERNRHRLGVFSNLALKIFMIPVFLVHFSLFCLVHLAFICGVFGKNAPFGTGNAIGSVPVPANSTSILAHLSRLFENSGAPDTIYLASVGLLVSHGISFLMNFLRGGEYRRVSVVELSNRPYGRVCVMHLTIIFGAGILVSHGEAWHAVAILVGLKTLMDLFAHLSERARFRN